VGKKICPLIKDECLEHGCEWYVEIMGTNPQTGVPMAQHDCTFKWLPLLLIENSQQTRQAGAATESFRNEFVKRSDLDLQTRALSYGDILRRLGHDPGTHHLPPVDGSGRAADPDASGW